jgi:hypothetical protein
VRGKPVLPAAEVFAALAECHCEPGLTEAKVRDAISNHLAKRGFRSKRSAGIHGQSVRADIFFEHRGEEFHLTARAPVSDAKVTTLLGELLVVTQALVLDDQPRKVHVMILVASKKEAGPLDTLSKGVTCLGLLLRKSDQSKRAEVHLGFATSRHRS